MRNPNIVAYILANDRPRVSDDTFRKHGWRAGETNAGSKKNVASCRVIVTNDGITLVGIACRLPATARLDDMVATTIGNGQRYSPMTLAKASHRLNTQANHHASSSCQYTAHSKNVPVKNG